MIDNDCRNGVYAPDVESGSRRLPYSVLYRPEVSVKGFPFSSRSVVPSLPGARRLLPLNDRYAFQTMRAAAPRRTRWRLLLEIG
jgi:hypothetical protein